MRISIEQEGESQSITEEVLLLVLTPRLGQRLTQLQTHRVQALEDSLLPLSLDLGHVRQRLPDPPAVLLLDPLLQPLAAHQVEDTVLQPQHSILHWYITTKEQILFSNASTKIKRKKLKRDYNEMLYLLGLYARGGKSFGIDIIMNCSVFRLKMVNSIR